MMRWGEAALFLMPFVLYAAWRIASIYAKPAVAWAGVAVVAVLMIAIVWIGVSHRLDPAQTYVPAQMRDGHVVPGHGVRLSKP